MCVLYVCEEKIPSLKRLEANQWLNDDGNGVAWIEKGKVRWQKGIVTAYALHSLMKVLPLPIIAHQRMRSAGTTCPELTHPFPVNDRVDLRLAGTAKSVLFHNGTVSDWEKDLERARGFVKMPGGEWSDTRMMAWMYARYGETVLHRYAAGQRVAVLTPDGPVVYNPKLWCYAPKETGGYWQSSDYSRTAISSSYYSHFDLDNLPEAWRPVRTIADEVADEGWEERRRRAVETVSAANKGDDTEPYGKWWTRRGKQYKENK